MKFQKLLINVAFVGLASLGVQASHLLPLCLLVMSVYKSVKVTLTLEKVMLKMLHLQTLIARI